MRCWRPAHDRRTPCLSRRAKTWAAAKAHRAERIERREAFLDLIPFGYSYRQIAAATRVSLADGPARSRQGARRAAAARARAPLGPSPGVAHGDMRAFAFMLARTRSFGFQQSRPRGEGVAKLLRKALKTLDLEKKMKGNEREFRRSSACFGDFAASRCGFAYSDFLQGIRFPSALEAPRAVSRRRVIRARPPCRFPPPGPAGASGRAGLATPSPPSRRSCTIRRPTR